LKILLVHAFYRQPGGEDEVFRSEAALLERHGHTVIRHTARNEDLPEGHRLRLALDTTWNRVRHREFRALLCREKPDIVHCHNLFPALSPAIYHAAWKERTPVVQTVHNYRLFCPNGLLYRGARPCEECLGKRLAWPGVLHGCYRGSRPASAAVAAMLATHRLLGTWADKVHTYIALSEFARDKLVRGGLPAERIRVKPNFVDPDPGPGNGRGGFALFVGRLSAEKGIDTLLDAWSRPAALPPLKVAGDGPLADRVAHAAQSSGGAVGRLGRRNREEVLALMKSAAFLVAPSLAYEAFPLTVLEAFATGLPVVASGHGALAEIVTEGQTGMVFRPGDGAGLADRAAWLAARPAERARMGLAARAAFTGRYGAEQNLAALMEIYASAAKAAVT
jgi:glycosyltransferase involved in cell wall biosynthesis